MRLRRAPAPTTIEQDGIHIPLDDPNITGPVREVMEQGLYESGDIRALKALVLPGDKVMEVGGGIGFVSALAAKFVGSENVFTYEANPAMEGSIRRLWSMNDVAPQLTIAAVSDRAGTVKLSSEPAYWDVRVTDSGQEVAAVAFADELERVRPTLLLMDCEGSEERLLGPIPLPASLTRVISELHPELIGARACNAVIRAMLNQGFELRLDLCGGPLWTFVRPSVDTA
jgi:FkbM family methyltransferase